MDELGCIYREINKYEASLFDYKKKIKINMKLHYLTCRGLEDTLHVTSEMNDIVHMAADPIFALPLTIFA